MLPLGLSLDKYSGLDWRSPHDLMVPCKTYTFGPLQLGLMCAATDSHGPGEGVDAMHFVCTNTSKTEIISDIHIAIRTSHESKHYVIAHTPEELLIPDAIGPATSVATKWFYVWPYRNNEEYRKETFNIKHIFWVTYSISFSADQQHWDEQVTMDPPDLGETPYIDYAKREGGPHV